MRKWLLLALTFLMIRTAANADLPPVGYIGLYTNDQHSCRCADGVGFYPVEMWVWCLPSMNGQMGADFEIGYPANTIRSTLTLNSDIISIVTGTLDEGMGVFYNSCQWDWHWCCHQTIYVTDQTQTYCEIIPHSDIGVYQFITCQEGNPAEPCVKYSNAYGAGCQDIRFPLAWCTWSCIQRPPPLV